MARSSPGVVVVGSTNTDMVAMSKTLPLPGQTLTGGPFYTAAGGKGANQAVAAARCLKSASAKDTGVVFVGAIGDDDLGCAAVLGLQSDGIKGERIPTLLTVCRSDERAILSEHAFVGNT